MVFQKCTSKYNLEKVIIQVLFNSKWKYRTFIGTEHGKEFQLY